MCDGKSTYEFKKNLQAEYDQMMTELFEWYARNVRIYYGIRYKAEEYRNISGDELKAGIAKLVELAEWWKSFPKDAEVDEDQVMMDKGT
jgi:hypothetical protein